MKKYPDRSECEIQKTDILCEIRRESIHHKEKNQQNFLFNNNKLKKISIFVKTNQIISESSYRISYIYNLSLNCLMNTAPERY